MDLLRRFPVTAMFFAFFLSSCLLAYSSFPLRMAAATLSALVLTVTLFLRRGRIKDPGTKQAVLFLCAGIAAASLISAAAWDLYLPWIESRAGRTEEAELRVTECEYSSVYLSRYRAVVEKSDSLPRGTGILLETPASGYTDGTILRGEVRYDSLASLSSGSYDARQAHVTERIFLAAEGSPEVVGQRRFPTPASLVRSLRARLSSRLLSMLGKEAGGFASAVLIGDRDRLPAALSRDFRRLGLSHLLVVSGAHFSALVSMLERLFRRLRLRKDLRAWTGIAVVLALMGLTGGSPSVMRAGIMHLLMQISLLVSKKPNSFHSFALSGSLLLLFNPFGAVNVGLQLSFAATFACLLWLRGRGRVFRAVRNRTGLRGGKSASLPVRIGFSAAETVLLTAAVTLATLPLIWLYFGELPLLSIPANLVFQPLIPLFLGPGWIFLLLCRVPVVSSLLGAFLILLYRAASGLAGWAAGFSGILLPVNYSFAPLFLLPASVTLAAVPFFSPKGKKRAAAASVSLILVFLGAVGIARVLSRNEVDFIRLNAGKNEGFVLRADNRILLCDMSDGSSAFLSRLTGEMDALHACEIDAVALTHYHNRHTQLLGRLFERETVRALWLPDPGNEDEERICRALADLAGQHGVETVMLPPEGETEFCGIPLTVHARTDLGRSSHPIAAASVFLPSARVFFASSSFNEGTGLTEAAEDSDILFLGAHSPVYKKTFELSFQREPKILVLCPDAEAHADPVLLESLGERYPACEVRIAEDASPVRLRDKKPG